MVSLVIESPCVCMQVATPITYILLQHHHHQSPIFSFNITITHILPWQEFLLHVRLDSRGGLGPQLFPGRNACYMSWTVGKVGVGCAMATRPRRASWERLQSVFCNTLWRPRWPSVCVYQHIADTSNGVISVPPHSNSLLGGVAQLRIVAKLAAS